MAGEQTEDQTGTLVGKILPGVLTATILAIAAAAVSLYLDSNDHIKRIIDNEADILIIVEKLDTIIEQKEKIRLQDLETKIRVDNLYQTVLVEQAKCTNTIEQMAILKQEIDRLKWRLDNGPNFN